MTTVTSPGAAIPKVDAERHLLAAIAADVVADFSARPAGQRQLTAAFLEGLIAGTDESRTALRGALRIRGADIVGRLRPLARMRGDGLALLFWSCQFDSPVDLSGGDFLSLRFVDCTLPAFIGASLTTKADLDLSGSRFSGVDDYACELADVGTCAIHLSNARIGGRLAISSTTQARSRMNGVVRLEDRKSVV